MNFTKREIFLLKILIFVIIVAFTYNFVLAPQLEELSKIKNMLAEKKIEVELAKQEILSLNKLEEDIHGLNHEIKDLSKEFFKDMQLKNIITILEEQLKASGAEVISLDFSEFNIIEESILNNYEDNNQEELRLQPLQTEESVSDSIKSISVDISLLGTFSQIMDFISRLEDMNKNFVINNLQLNQEDNGNISGIINMELYSLKELNYK